MAEQSDLIHVSNLPEIHSYYYASPQIPAPVGLLKRVVKASNTSSRSNSVVTAANALAELSLHPSIRSGRRTAYARQAGVHILSHIMLGGRAVDRRTIAPLQVHLPLYVRGATERAKVVTKQQIGMHVEKSLLPLCLGCDGDGKERGTVLEHLVDLTLGHTGIAGITVLPASSRQNLGHTRVDDKPYAWDLSVFSDGSVLDEGEYRVQVKNKVTRRSGDKYHPDIAVVHGDRHLGIPSTDPWALTEYFRNVMRAGDEGGEALNIRRARFAVLEVLDAVGPVEQPASVFPAA